MWIMSQTPPPYITLSASHSYLCCPSQVESDWLMPHHHQHTSVSTLNSILPRARQHGWMGGKGFSIIGFAQHNNCPHEPQFSWTAPCLAGSSHLLRGERLCRGFMEPCITLRHSIMTASQVLNSQDRAKSIVGSCNFFFFLLCFACWNKGHLQGNMHYPVGVQMTWLIGLVVIHLWSLSIFQEANLHFAFAPASS